MTEEKGEKAKDEPVAYEKSEKINFFANQINYSI